MEENNILNTNQKCSNSKRSIFEAVHAIKDRLVQINCRKMSAKLISFDLDHAFDRVDRNFLFDVLRRMHFNADFVSLLDKIMSTSSSRLLINGNLSPQFPILRSVRQGDPLSMHLFVLYLHPLLEKLNFICNHPLELVVAYADDISIVLVDEDKLDFIKQVFINFGLCSGAILNISKTFAINVGKHQTSRSPAWLAVRESVKILGVTYFNSLKETIEFNWRDAIRKTSQLMWMFKPRILSLHQKIIVLNIFVTSRLWFLASVISISNSAIARMTSQIGYFIWKRYPTRVAIEQLTLPIHKGGLNLHLPMHNCKALLITRFIKVRECIPFAQSFSEFLVNPPYTQGIPALYPCLKYIAKEIPYIPERLVMNPSTVALHDYFRENLSIPKVMEEHPNISWPRVWSNIRNKHLTSLERSTYFLLVNGKIPHSELFFRQGRRDNPTCQHCPNITEDLEHKFTLCCRVRNLWNYLRPILETVLGRRIHYRNLEIPELTNTSSLIRIRILKLFITYVTFVLDSSNIMSVEALKVILDIE